MIGNLIRAAMQQRIAQQNAQPRMMRTGFGETDPAAGPGGPQGGFGRLMRGARDWGRFLGDVGMGTITSPLYGFGLLQRPQSNRIAPSGPMGRAFDGYTPGGFGVYEAVNDAWSEHDPEGFRQHYFGIRPRQIRERLSIHHRRMQPELEDQINQERSPPPPASFPTPTGGIPSGRTGTPSYGGAGGGYSGRTLTPTGLFDRRRRGIVTVGPIPDDEEN